MFDGKLIVFSAPSGAGKTTIVHHLIKQQELNLDFSISATSRASRGDEVDGKDYYFLSAEAFKEKIINEEFLEHEEVYPDNFYGTLKSEIQRIWSTGKHVIFDIDVVGGLNIKKQFPEETLAIFIEPPSVEELEKRLRNRKTETEEKIAMRMAKASKELAAAKLFDVAIENNNLAQAKATAYKKVAAFLSKKKTKKIGLYFGTFNPIHIGHLCIANHLAEHSDINEIWMVITPHNPFKKKSSLLANNHRLDMVYEATKAYGKIAPSTVEFKLTQPNFTINTLVHLEEKYPDYSFALIMGEDNLKSFHKWRNYETILERHHLYVYPRISSGTISHQFKNHPKIHSIAAPIMEISSTFIRNSIKQGKNIRPLLPEAVFNYIDEMNFYKN
jgi:nicotinate-nucleotide adenylyltransferase